ncbi:MAG: alanine racemase [Candidatus Eisenbacteria sp.]|nr:alanine racemase [Candidatus Eisenbacteria bacterium]
MNASSSNRSCLLGTGTRCSHWIEISPKAYRHNLRGLRHLLKPDVKLMAVVKANAYGHGARLITPLAVAAGADYLGVDSLAEFEEIRDLCEGVPVCILGPILPSEAQAVVASGVEPAVSSMEVALALARAARTTNQHVRIHIKVETGTHRQGILPEEIPDWCAFFAKYPLMRFRGLHTHFANIEDTTDHTVARRQLARMKEARQVFADLGQTPDITHSACSAATIVMEETHGDMVRLGIASFGLWPSRETYLSTLLSHRMGPELLPVLSWKARIAQIKGVEPGEFVGYGCTFRTTHAMRIAVLPVGYYDAYDRRLSGHGYVLASGKRAPIVGRVCMNMTMIDISDIPDPQLGQEVTLIGRHGAEVITADTLAALCGTINYEIVSRLGRHIPRMLAKEATE